MTKTTNYQLPQWEASDPIRRGDFNAAMGAIDAGVSRAQETAETLPYAVGSYTGNNGTVTVSVGFRPSFLILSGSSYAIASNQAQLGQHDLFTAGNILSDRAVFTDDGFTLTYTSNFPMLTASGRVYDYIAFR